MKLHAIHHLYNERLARSTRPYKARGANIVRCVGCMLVESLCICQQSKRQKTNAAFLLVMYDDEVLKPSNTGRLIADIVEDTYAYIWSRTSPDPAMIELIKDPKWQPFVIFPAQYTEKERLVSKPEVTKGKRPLFILIDGTWSEAKKIFRKSDWLNAYPVLSVIDPIASKYKVRAATGLDQLATAEVATHVLHMAKETQAALHLDAWFDVFREHYLTGKKQRQLPKNGALSYYHTLK